MEQTLSPRDLKAKIYAQVLARESFFDDSNEDSGESSDSRYRRAETKAEELGNLAAINNEILDELLPDLLYHDTDKKVWRFGVGVGQKMQDTARVISQARQLLASNLQGSVNIQFLRGFISGWNQVSPGEVSSFLDEALYDEVWGWWFIGLQLEVELDCIGYERLLKSLDIGRAPIWQYRLLGVGRVRDPLSVNQISALIGKITSKPEGGLSVSIDVLSMVILCAEEMDADYHHSLTTICISFLLNLDWSKIQNCSDNIFYEINVILEFALASSKFENEIFVILHHLLDYLRSLRWLSSSHNMGKFLAPFFKFYPREALDAVYIADPDGRYWTASRIVSDSDGDLQETVIRFVPVDTLIEWCEVAPEDRCIFAAQTCRLFESNTEGSGSLSLTDDSIRVLSNARNKKEVLRIFMHRLYPSTWWGSRSEALRKRFSLLAALNTNNDEVLRIEIEKIEEEMSRIIAEAIEQEKAEEREQIGSFGTGVV